MISIKVLIFCCLIAQIDCEIEIVKPKDLELPRYISSLIGQANEKDSTRNHNVVLIQMEVAPNNSTTKELFFDILEEISRQNRFNQIFVHESPKPIEKFRIHSASFVVIVSDIEDLLTLVKTFIKIYMKNHWSISPKFIFVPTDDKPETIARTFLFLEFLGVVDAILVHKDETLKVYSSNCFIHKNYTFQITKDFDKFEKVFEDKFKNMHGHLFKALFRLQPPRINFINNTLFGIDLSIMEIIEKHHNAGAGLYHWLPANNYYRVLVEQMLMRQTYDFTLNFVGQSGAQSLHREQVVNTFDVNSFCALVPIPPRISFLSYLLMPLDFLTWICLSISIVLSAIMWKYLKRNLKINSNSSIYFIFGVVVTFVGQSIPFRKSHKMQTAIMQLCILMTFILGNAYQSIVITTMFQSREGIRYRTFDEMFDDNNQNIHINPYVYSIYNQSGEYRSALQRNIPLTSVEINLSELYPTKMAFVLRCDQAKSLVKIYPDEPYYLLPDQIINIYETFFLRPYSPLFEMLQKDLQLIFESGIRQYLWEEIGRKILDHAQKVERKIEENEIILLSMDDVYGVFYILLTGLGIGLITFVFEFFKVSEHFSKRKHRRVFNL